MPESIDVTTLGLPQLEQIRDNLGEDIEQIQEGLNALKQATYGYIQSKEAAKSITPANEGKEILIPMTSSLFVPGKLGNTQKVLLDIGAGYLVEQTPEKAQEYFDRRADAVKDQMEKLNASLEQKKNGQEQIIMLMQQKIASISQTQQAQEGISGLNINQ
mmetsp:Transcript_21665/g.37022  ORF Transcript_21665/g.37022 Transcript_21665/m.37022 type:complete len:160 (+) Transcript_21665:27-506(+)